MKTLDLYLNEQLKNEEFRKEWEENQPEMDIIRAMADARISQHLTQRSWPNAPASIRRISASWKMEHATHL